MNRKSRIVAALWFVLFAGLISLVVWADVTTTTTKTSYSCNGSTTTFDFSFPIVETSDLTVLTRVTSTGVETTLTETTDYSLSATNNDYSNGGTVTTVSTYSSGTTIHLIRQTPQTQSTTLQDSGILRVAALEDALDRLTLLTQQQQEQLDRAMLIPKSEDLDMALASSVDRANQYLVFSATGVPTVASSGFESDDYTVSSYMEGILDDTSEGVFKATVNLEIGTDVQAYDAELAGIASVTSAANKIPYFTGSGTASVADLTAFARTYLDDADGATVLDTLDVFGTRNLKDSVGVDDIAITSIYKASGNGVIIVYDDDSDDPIICYCETVDATPDEVVAIGVEAGSGLATSATFHVKKDDYFQVTCGSAVTTITWLPFGNGLCVKQ